MDRGIIKETFTPYITKLMHLFGVELETCKYQLNSQREQVSLLFISTIGHIHTLSTLFGTPVYLLIHPIISSAMQFIKSCRYEPAASGHVHINHQKGLAQGLNSDSLAAPGWNP